MSATIHKLVSGSVISQSVLSHIHSMTDSSETCNITIALHETANNDNTHNND